MLDNSIREIGYGKIGGKAQGLIQSQKILNSLFNNNDKIHFQIPPFTILKTSIFDDFIKRNQLSNLFHENFSDDMIAHEFIKGEFSPIIIGELYQLISKQHNPLAIRSSAVIEDSIEAPFAGVFETKMISNNQNDMESRFHRLLDAIKYVYASLFFKQSKDYFLAVKKDITQEKMAVIIQNVHGNKYNEYFYPILSGVARSYNFYPGKKEKPENGVVCLALGLGKTIVDGGSVWSYSPSRPKAGPPFNSIQDMMKNTQIHFWAIDMKKDRYDPVKGTEFIEHLNYNEAHKNVLLYISSYYDPANDRLEIGSSNGPRVIDFAPILKANLIPLNSIVKNVMSALENAFNKKIEIEFAFNFLNGNLSKPSFALLQVRPMSATSEFIDLKNLFQKSENNFVYSEKTMGNGQITYIKDVVYVVKERFTFENTEEIAREIEQINNELIKKNIQYLLIGYGRWGSSDPFLGIPVNWSMISGAKIIIETNIGEKKPDLSQGSHFFHNIYNLKVFYYTIESQREQQIDWDWLEKQKVIKELKYIKHIQLEHTLNALIDGRTGKGVIQK